jgi:type IV secretion system protein VirD4
VLYAEPDKTLAGVANFLSDPKRPIETTLRAMMTTLHLGDQPHSVVASAARELLNKSENERSGVLSTAMSFLGLYRDPVGGKVTSRCDWRIADLVEAERPLTLYLVVPPSDISRTKRGLSPIDPADLRSREAARTWGNEWRRDTACRGCVQHRALRHVRYR